MKILVDMHHSSLLKSLQLLFEDRLEIETFRPIGMQWFFEGFWAINLNPSTGLDTAKQFLSKSQIPKDNTPPLNTVRNNKKGIFYCYDPDGIGLNRACTLDYFKRNKFDYVLASIPQHIPLFQRLIARYNPKAKLIIQVGNNWGISEYQNMNVLASINPYDIQGVNVQFYHQEFDLKVFYPTPNIQTKKIYSFVNVLENMPESQEDFNVLERLLRPFGYELSSFGGQNRDGNMNGSTELANKMREADFILHTKQGGDGFGHIIHNAYAVGRPVIIRSSQYRGQLAERLFQDGTFIDIDSLGRHHTAEAVRATTPEQLLQMGNLARQAFESAVDYDKEGEEIRRWLQNLS